MDPSRRCMGNQAANREVASGYVDISCDYLSASASSVIEYDFEIAMSALASSAAAPQTAPDQSGPRPVAPSPKASRKWWPLLLLLAVIAAAGLVLRLRERPKPAATVLVRTTRAFRGLLLRTVRLTGSVTATRFANVFAPSIQAPDAGRGLVLIYLPPSGSMVKQGQVVVEIDSLSVRDHLENVEAQVDQSEMDRRKLQARQDEETEVVRQRVRTARGRLDRARQDIRAAATRSRIDQELLRLAVEEAQATYDEAERQVAMTAERQEAAMRIQEIDQDGQVRHRNRHRHDLEQFTMTAPMAGQVVMKPIYRGGDRSTVQLGDMVSPAQPIMRIADLSSMEMESSMNQAESELIRIGQRATVRFDAYPDLKLPGMVKAIGTMAAGGRRVNYYVRRVAVRIAVEGRDPRMISDSTASADVVIGEQDDSVIVPRQAVVEADGRSVVYVKQDGGFSPREVEIGRCNNTEVAILSGLQAGEEIALQPPY
jgi:HlyD family secretion protein